MNKRSLVFLLALIIMTGLAACSVITPPAATEPTTTPPPPIIYGEWLWLGEVHYVFREDGSGLRGQRDIVWAAEDGVLTICSTPEFCEIAEHGSLEACIEPETWSYVLTANTLTITNLLTDVQFTYVRETIA